MVRIFILIHENNGVNEEILNTIISNNNYYELFKGMGNRINSEDYVKTITYDRIDHDDFYPINSYIDFISSLQDLGEFIDLTMYNDKGQLIFSAIRATNIFRDHLIVFNRKYNLYDWIIEFSKTHRKMSN